MHFTSALDVSAIIWLVIAFIAIVSSQVKKAQARRPVDPQAAAKAQQAIAQAAAQRSAALDAQRVRLAQVAAQAVRTPQPAPPARPAPIRPAAPPVRPPRPESPVTLASVDPFSSAGMTFEAPAPPPPIVHDSDMGLPTGVPKRFFENRQSLIWGVVMSEVLGRPKALAVEQNLWSPQHQPPSI